MRNKYNLRSCAAAILVLSSSAPAFSEVIDLNNGEFSNRTRTSSTFVQGVLDLDRPAPAVEDVQEVAATPSAVEVVASRGPNPRGKAEVEDLILKVGQNYMGHAGLRRAGLSGTQWLALFRANIAIESNFKQSARSQVGAIGLGQLMPETARRLNVDPYNAEQNLHGSARYLLTQLEAFGSAELALAAYNAGPGAVTQYGGIPPYRETQGHVRKVIAIYRSST